ncbi:BtrH N-terminal domain-containing protein [Streptomyces sp. NC-S4]
MTEQAPRPKPGGLLYEDFGTGRHRESSLVRHALGSVHEEELVAGLAGGIGFMYFVFEYAGHPPLLTIVAQAHPDPWVEAALDRLRVPYEVTRSARPRWDRVRAALDAGRPVFCTVDRSRLPWHGGTPDEMAGADPYTVVLAGYEGDSLYVEDGAPAAYRIAEQEFGEAWTGHRKGRHRMLVPTGPAAGAPDVDGAVAATAARLAGPVLGNRFDVNFGFSGMEKLSATSPDGRRRPLCSANRPSTGPGSRNWRARPARTPPPRGGAPSSTSSPDWSTAPSPWNAAPSPCSDPGTREPGNPGSREILRGGRPGTPGTPRASSAPPGSRPPRRPR